MLLKQTPVARTALQDALRDHSGWKGKKPEKTALLEEILATMQSEGFPGAVIPRLGKGRMIYYAVAETQSDWRSLQPLLRSAVGVTLTDFTGAAAELDGNDTFEATLLEKRFAVVSRFSPQGLPPLETATVAALRELIRSLGRRGRTRREIPKSTPQVLYEFRLALSAGDRVGADSAIAFLRANLRLDALNLHFLEVQRDATLQEWGHLWARPFFGSLCKTRRPPKVTAALIEALYRAIFLRYELDDDPAGAINQFRSVDLQPYIPLFAACPPWPQPGVTKMFLVAAAAAAVPDWSMVDQLTQVVSGWQANEQPFARRLLALLDGRRPALLVPQADNIFDLAAKVSTPPTAPLARALLLAAANQQTLEGYRIAVDYVQRLAPADRGALLAAPGFNSIWRDICRYAGQRGVPSSWGEWADWLPELSFAEAACAEQATDEWPITQQLRTPQDVQSLADSLQRAWGLAEDRLAHALPHMVTWVRQDDKWPNPDYYTLYETILQLLLLSTTRSAAVLGALVPLLDACFSLGMSAHAYSNLLRDLGDVVKSTASVRTIDWLLDVAELTIVHPCPDEGSRQTLWSQISANLQTLRHRITAAQVGLAVDIAASLGAPETFEPSEADAGTAQAGVSDDVTGMVAIYTLTESAGQRAQRILTATFPRLKVELVHDFVSTARLVNLARTADLFVVCWSSAKHAATIEIQQKRPVELPTVFAPGGGSSSIVRIVQERLVGGSMLVRSRSA